MGLLKIVEFNDGTRISVPDDGVVVFVGPNNVGKSQSLRDIYEKCEKDGARGVVVTGVELNKPTREDLLPLIKRHCKKDANDYYVAARARFNADSIGYIERLDGLRQLRDFLVSYLRTDERLSLVEPPPSVNSDEPRQHPIHYVALDPDYRVKLSGFFKRAFGSGLTPHLLFGRTVPLCIGDEVPPDPSLASMQESLEAYRDILDSYSQVQNQGDGVRSFTGVVLDLMLENYGLHLIDEPESFLHPPQAKIMGEVIGEMSKVGTQVVVATHSKYLVQGLVDTCPERVTIVRITRKGNENHFAVLESNDVGRIFSDPLLRHSEIGESMFHESAVLCESDADCKIYSIVLESIKADMGRYPQTQFLHCGGKQRMAEVVGVLRSLCVDYRIVPDIDVLNDKATIKKLVETCGGEWEDFDKDYRVLSSAIDQRKPFEVERRKVRTVLNGSRAKNLSGEEVTQIKELLNAKNPWDAMKKGGVVRIPSGNATEAFHRMDVKLRKLGIHLVPVGELEGFVGTVGGHGPRWVDAVLSKYPDPKDTSYDAIREFVSEWGL